MSSRARAGRGSSDGGRGLLNEIGAAGGIRTVDQVDPRPGEVEVPSKTYAVALESLLGPGGADRRHEAIRLEYERQVQVLEPYLKVRNDVDLLTAYAASLRQAGKALSVPLGWEPVGVALKQEARSVRSRLVKAKTLERQSYAENLAEIDKLRGLWLLLSFVAR